LKPEELVVDMDAIMVDLVGHWVKLINSDYGLGATVADVKDWDISLAFPTVPKKEVYAYLQKPGFFLFAPPMGGALETLEAIQNLGHDVLIASTPSGALSAKEKYEWLSLHAPFIKHSQVFLGDKKYRITGTMIVDDKPDTIIAYRKAHPHADAIAIGYPYNEHLRDLGDPRIRVAGSWRDPHAAWGEIFSHVLRRSA
jgi:5'-nucleotidase